MFPIYIPPCSRWSEHAPSCQCAWTGKVITKEEGSLANQNTSAEEQEARSRGAQYGGDAALDERKEEM